MPETEDEIVERITREVRRKREDPFYRGRYPSAAKEMERAGGTGLTMPEGMMRMPTRQEAGEFAGKQAVPLATQLLLQKMVGPLAGRLAPPVGAALRAGAGIAGAAAGGAGQAAYTGGDPGREALIGAGGAALGEGLAAPFGATGRSLLQRGAEPIGDAMRAVGRRIPGVQKLFEYAPGGAETIRLLAEEGDGRLPTLGQVSKSNSAIFAESMAQRAIGSHGALATAQQGAEENAKNIASGFVKKFMDVDRVEAGTLIDDVIKNRLANFRDASSQMYGPLDKALGTEAVATQPMKDAAQKLLDTSIGIKSDKTSALLNAVAELPDTISFAKASAIRSDLLRVNRDIDALIGGQAKRTATDLFQIIDDGMEKAADRLNPMLKQQWRDAQAFYKRGAELFNDDIIEAMAKQEPETMADYLFSLNEGTVRRSALERLRKISSGYGGGRGNVGPISIGDALEPVRGAFIKKLMRESADTERLYGENAVQFLDGRKMRQTLGRFEKSELEPLLGKDNAQKLGDISRAIEQTQKRSKNMIGTSGLPSMVLLQGGASFGIWNSDQPGPAKAAELGTVWFLGPRAIAWALKDPAVVKMLASNQRVMAPGSDITSKFASQFTARMLSAQRIFGSEEVRPQRGKMKDQPLSLNDPSRRATTFEETTR